MKGNCLSSAKFWTIKLPPLKSTAKVSTGKIDLLAYDGTTPHIIELKEPDRQETMVHCVQEGYKYLKTVDKENCLRILNSLPIHS